MDISLRKKRSATPTRPKISAPQQVSSNALEKLKERPTRLQEAQSSNSLVGSRDTSRIRDNADYVKRRYSTKLTQVPRDVNVPSVPGIPGRYQSSSPTRLPRAGKGSGGDKIPIDLASLQSSDLQTEQCGCPVTSHMHTRSEA